MISRREEKLWAMCMGFSRVLVSASWAEAEMGLLLTLL